MQGWEKWTGSPLQLSIAGHAIEITPQWWLLITMVVSIVTYVGVSLLTRRGESFDLDRLLYRGAWRDAAAPLEDDRHLPLWKRICGITPEFTPRDRLTVSLFFGWVFTWCAGCLVMIALSISGKIGSAEWAGFWKVYLIALFGLLVFTTIWLGMGGVRDLKTMFRLLREERSEASDDGTVPESATEDITPDKAADPA
jgi:hypothetical protein